MKTLSKILAIIVTLTIMISAFAINVSAAKSAVIHFSKTTVSVGDKVTVSVAVNPDVKLYGVEFCLEYDDEVLKYDSGDGTGDAGVLKVAESPKGEKGVRYNFTFTAKKVGSSSFTVKDCKYSTIGNDGMATDPVAFAGAGAKMTVKDAALSDDAKLSSLKVSGHSLSPNFSSSKTSYTLKVKNDVEKINVTATPNDDNAKVVSVTGNTDLKVGTNTVTVTVEAQNGTQKKYTIKVTREKEEDASEETTSSEETESEETESEETESAESTETNLQTTLDGKDYLLVTKIPEKALFDGFKIVTTQVNNYDIEVAVDADENYRIFYLMPADSNELVPFLYDEDLDQFERLQYTKFNKKNYIFDELPTDLPYSETLYESTVEIGDATAPCMADSINELSDFYYVYCYVDGNYGMYRYDSLEKTLQRYPDFQFAPTNVNETKKDNIITRFSTLSTNGKIIFICLVILIMGVFSLLVLLVVYLIKKGYGSNDDIILSDDDMDFDEIKVEKENVNVE